MKHIASSLLAFAILALSACTSIPGPGSPQDAFFARLTDLCGQTFEGQLVTTDPTDAGMASQRLLMQVRDCSADEIRIPFQVGEDRSRTWVVTRTSDGLRLKHDHRDPQGRPDGLHWYGGDTVSPGTVERQEFPVDQFSIDLFNAGNAAVSTTNVWAMEVHPGRVFAYELRRENRHFRVEFDLSRPLTD
ncbi:hypothetical protein [uncultured Brevundimonas sp.]|uniref:hypothetical protein n=1 Tax=uncultured Brevundimonas sp. TaxID=213418 RepID=UPI0030EC1CF8|tara:strand:- start:1941 stop:2507 length:567 start_codon:yes stop_codon:yes gene_type:complete